ncbi:NF-X1 type zinc finger family protein [Rhynchospora pubera]|uniref:NF-X1 type zinc finger family protein n=1 Tax=Rhynchospora pubera TaxID=906938 RepID=A0AAV8FNG5_9POAL|nr:NF-X1 type zinc finger family protein [Rhynchospora pubera]
MRPDRRNATTTTTTSNRRVWQPRGGAESSAPSHPSPDLTPIPTPASASAPSRPSDQPHNNPPNPNHAPRHRYHQPHTRTRYNRNHNRPSQQPTPHPPHAPLAPVEGVPQLVQEIQDKLSRGTVECMICYDMVRRTAPVWSCTSCFSIFHLQCARKWARSPSSMADPITGGWRCPGCQSVQSVPSKELSYTCFCGRRRDPLNDLYLTPHSCGEPCGKSLDKTENNSEEGTRDKELEEAMKCPHVCVLQCHPGPCPPCKAFAPRRPCPCGKNILARRCSDRTSPLSCGQQCGRLLECGRHSCEKVCHTGPCESCTVLVTASCFCRKKTEMVLCGEMAIKGELKENAGVFFCDLVCGRKLACGNHTCSDSCHPGPCGECEFVPTKIKTCHCGKTPLEKERESCLDPIPTCSEVCAKALPCGIHFCKDTCHEGDCPPCLVKVEQRCRCGSSTRTIECFKVSEVKDAFLCPKQCGRKKNCGRHRCNESCCPLSRNSGQMDSAEWDPHLCSMPCGKKLRCGQHTCQLLCHSGHCPPCLETIFTDLTCACGKTSIPPPVPCGTPPPSCTHACIVPQPCGHLATHTCHFGACPPCIVPVPKECIGGHVLLKNIPCGSKEIRCNHLCGKTRRCGLHACARPCHAPPCDAMSPDSSSGSELDEVKSCGQVCGAPRMDCKHTCNAPCHPEMPCPDLMCQFRVSITCLCGRISASVPCCAGGSSEVSSFELNIIQKLPVPLHPLEANGRRVPLGQRKLACDEECAKLERRKVLADAFDITPPNLEGLNIGDNSSATSELISDFMRRDAKWVISIEERCKALVLGKSKGSSSASGSSSMRVHVFCNMVKEKRDVLWVIAERWKLSVHAAGWEPKRFLVVHATPKSKAPQRILGLRPGMPVTAHVPAFDPMVDMDPRLVVAMLDLPREADVSSLVLRFGGECELVWLTDRNALAIFNDATRAATALRRLDYGSAYNGAVVVMPTSTGLVSGSGTSMGMGGTGVGRSVTNPWKKALVSEPNAWGDNGPVVDSIGDVAKPARHVNEVPPMTTLSNRWKVLGSDLGSNTGTRDFVVDRKMDIGPEIEVKNDEGSSSRSERKHEMDEAVDDWEKACGEE